MSYTSDRLILQSVYVCIISVYVLTEPPITAASAHTEHSDSTESRVTGGVRPSSLSHIAMVPRTESRSALK